MKIWKLNEVFLYLYFVKIRYSTLSLCTAVQTYAPKIEFKKILRTDSLSIEYNFGTQSDIGDTL